MIINCPMCNKQILKKKAIIYMWEQCPYSQEAYNTLVGMYKKKNVQKVIIDDPVMMRKQLSEHFGNTEGTTVPFMIIDNKTFIGSNDELQKSIKA